MAHVTVGVAWGDGDPRITLSDLPAKFTPEEWEKVRAMVASMVPGYVPELTPPPDGTREISYTGTPRVAPVTLRPEA